MPKILILIIIGMILIPPAFGVQDAYTQFECEVGLPEVCLSRVIAKLQQQISTLETKNQEQDQTIQALKKENAALATQLKNSLRTLKEEIEMLKSRAFQDRLKDGRFGPQMVWIPAGRFRMGDMNVTVTSFQGGGDSDEKPVHEVSINRFAMSRYEVTFAEYDKFAEATGRQKPDDEGWGRGTRPVINVSWHDANAYAEWLSQQTGKQYRLPSEAEWEYAARAGTETKYWWGNEIGSNKANCSNRYCGDRFKYTAPVGSFAPNLFGLYDTVGNVWEWTCSEYSSSYDGRENACNENVSLGVIRGGSWYTKPRYVRVSYRYRNSDGYRNGNVGFRLARP